jgi:hypothetical protein
MPAPLASRYLTLALLLTLSACSRSQTTADPSAGASADPSTAVIGRAPTDTDPSASTRLNALATLITDMSLPNDLPLAGVPQQTGWAKGPGHVVMGNDPRGSRTPRWWQPADPRYKSTQWWTVLVPWFVVFDGEGHASTHTRVEVRRMQVFVLSRASGQWQPLARDGRIEGALYPKTLTGNPVATADLRPTGNTGASIAVPAGDRLFHGWCCGRLNIDAPDVGAVFVTLQARLKTDGVDDSAQARLLLQVGADYYPDAATQVVAFAPAAYNPGVGLSRAKRLSADWQAFNFITLDVGVQDPGGASISVAALQAAPPPLE